MSGPVALGFEETYRACREGVVARVTTCDVVRVVGPDALSYLQSQCSQDLAALGVGDSVGSLLLNPQGHVDALVRVARVAQDDALVVVSAGFGDVVHDRLRRFKLRVKADLEQHSWPLVELRGPRSASAVGPPTPRLLAIAVDWLGESGVDLVGPGAAVPAGVDLGDERAFDAVRVEAGEPAMGAEISGRTIAQEAGLVARAVSLTKGCYPGQELVARIDARGDNVPKRLRGIVVAPAPPDGGLTSVRPGSPVSVDGDVVGSLTSVAWSPRLSTTIALGYVHRRAVPPLRGRVERPDGTLVECEIVELPIAAP